MHHIIGAQQYIHFTAALAMVRHHAAKFAQRQPHTMAAAHLAAQQHALADKAGNGGGGGVVVEIIGRVPLLQAAIGHDADFVGHGKGFLLIVRYQ